MLNHFSLKNLSTEATNLTGIRLLVLFTLLIESPKTAEEINNYFAKNNYPNNTFSLDTLRNDLNVLRQAGCNISKANKSTDYKYVLQEHPLNLDITKQQAKTISRLYSMIYQHLSIDDLICFDELFRKLALYTKSDSVSEYIMGISKTLNTAKIHLLVLKSACDKKQTITFNYKIPQSEMQEIRLVADKLSFLNSKLYLFGYSLTHESNGYFNVKNILQPIIINIDTKEHLSETLIVKYELQNKALKNFVPDKDNIIVEKTDSTAIIESTVNNKFIITQKLLEFGADCKVLSPECFKHEFIEKLKKMREAYDNI